MKIVFDKEFVISANAPTPSCHASTLVKADNGEICVAWFGGEHEGSTDVDIWLSRRGKGGVWSQPQRISAADSLPHWNPVLEKKPGGTLCLYFKVGLKIADWKTYFVLSEDNGKTWSTPLELVEGDTSGGRGPVKNKTLRLTDGRLLAPASSEQNKDWKVFADISDDGGKTWHRSDFVERPVRYKKTVAMIQPTLWEDGNGVHMLVRTNSGFIYRSDSVDRGESWCKAYRTELFNNNSGIDVAKIADGSLWLVSNPVRKNWGERSPLTVACSRDAGKSFDMGFVLESQTGEYSYPSITADSNELLISYTWNRKKIVFVRAVISG